jgi:hypothetical protein
VALRPRLSPGLPLSMGGSAEIRSGTGIVKCGLQSQLTASATAYWLLGNLRRGASSSVRAVQLAGAAKLWVLASSAGRF